MNQDSTRVSAAGRQVCKSGVAAEAGEILGKPLPVPLSRVEFEAAITAYEEGEMATDLGT